MGLGGRIGVSSCITDDLLVVALALLASREWLVLTRDWPPELLFRAEAGRALETAH